MWGYPNLWSKLSSEEWASFITLLQESRISASRPSVTDDMQQTQGHQMQDVNMDSGLQHANISVIVGDLHESTVHDGMQGQNTEDCRSRT